MIVDIFLKIAQNIPLSQSEMEELSAYISASHTTTAKITNMREIGELAYDLGEVWAGRFIASADPNNNDVASSAFTGTYMDASGVTGKNAGTTQFSLSSTTGKATVGAGAVTMDADGVTLVRPASQLDPNSIKWKDTSTTLGIYNFLLSSVNYAYFNAMAKIGEDVEVNIGAIRSVLRSNIVLSGNSTDAIARMEVFNGTGTSTAKLELKNGTITTAGNVTIGTASDTVKVLGTLDTSGVVCSGTYTPTLSNTTNVAASTARVCQYMRVGSVVTVSGSVNIAPTATGATVLTMSLPIASNFANTYELGGSGAPDITTPIPVVIRGSSTADAAIFVFNATSTAAQEVYFTFAYRII